CAGEADEIHDDAKPAAEEIPGASSASLAGHSLISAFYEADDLLLPHILELLHSATPTPKPAGFGGRFAHSARWSSPGELVRRLQQAPYDPELVFVPRAIDERPSPLWTRLAR